jgi:hypothetical protein
MRKRAVPRGRPFFYACRHCEERSDAAFQEHQLDCFAALAMTKLGFLALALLLTACRREQRPPAPTAEQSAQLNEAEDMLNDIAANEEGPEDRSSSPSNSS